MSRLLPASEGTDWESGLGQSEAFKDLQRALRDVHAHATKPITFGWKQALKDQVLDIGGECSKQGWDGYNAAPITGEAVGRAYDLVIRLPESMRSPDLCPSPEGEISFEWYFGKDRLLSVTPKENLLFYAAVLGPDHTASGKGPITNAWSKEISDIFGEYFK